MSTRNPSAPVYRDWDQQTLDAAYDNSKAVPNVQNYLADWTARSEIMRARPGAVLDRPYADGARTCTDFLPAPGEGGPLFVFIHGGYWQRNAKEMFAFVAEGLHPLGINVALVGYTLAPEATLTQIVSEIDLALEALMRDAGAPAFSRDAVVVGGWSAGGHLAAMAARSAAIRGVMPISGIFDLEPIAASYLDAALHLTPAEVEALSPLRIAADLAAPTCLYVGGDELPELRRQTDEYHAAREAAGLSGTCTLLPGCNHFEVLEHFANPDSVLCRDLLAMLRTP
ncbi:alpha/beta hydrolase [Acuticoccus sp. MNP-M23]|uniref:alpha/beta hydrolase n=1 Tax=Acuticoccus sp. MNP-M23 TaxID=3072793 RepID=UPI0028158C6F|nr:alpha/beta hydrolase [Acuticoccus sp. MNP-M23]WMS43955.1 alpha/beta hydrolase [Acuticoccus sp. MNP-M23]